MPHRSQQQRMLVDAVKRLTLVDQIGEAPHPLHLCHLHTGLFTLGIVDVVEGLP